jgi:hypothetical protein
MTLLTRQEVMDFLRIKKSKFHDLQKRNVIQPYKIVGTKKLYLKEELLTKKLV